MNIICKECFKTQIRKLLLLMSLVHGIPRIIAESITQSSVRLNSQLNVANYPHVTHYASVTDMYILCKTFKPSPINYCAFSHSSTWFRKPGYQLKTRKSGYQSKSMTIYCHFGGFMYFLEPFFFFYLLQNGANMRIGIITHRIRSKQVIIYKQILQ